MKNIVDRKFKKVVVAGGIVLSGVISLTAVKSMKEPKQDPNYIPIEQVISMDATTEEVTTEEPTSEELNNARIEESVNTIKNLVDIYNDNIENKIDIDDVGIVKGETQFMYISNYHDNYNYVESYYEPAKGDNVSDPFTAFRYILIDTKNESIIGATSSGNDIFVESYLFNQKPISSNDNSISLSSVNYISLDDYVTYREHKLDEEKRNIL